MWIKMILSGLIGLVFGTVGMAVLASGGRAGEMEKETILKEALRNVLKWYHLNGQSRFPEQIVKDALKVD